jgi:hypothetical protein
MLKRILATTALLAICALPLSAQQAAAAPAPDVTITGQVVDLNCFTTMGASGASHKTCASACAKAGVALAILSDGNLYMPVSAKPGDPQNSRLEPFAEGKVKVTGTHRMSNGMHTIQIKTIAAAT